MVGLLNPLDELDKRCKASAMRLFLLLIFLGLASPVFAGTNWIVRAGEGVTVVTGVVRAPTPQHTPMLKESSASPLTLKVSFKNEGGMGIQVITLKPVSLVIRKQLKVGDEVRIQDAKGKVVSVKVEAL